jgi:hypothetical protein
MTQPQQHAPPATEQAPPRLRLKLGTAGEVRRELARLYREGKSGQRDVADVSRLANVLSLLSRAIEVEELERRINELESNT